MQKIKIIIQEIGIFSLSLTIVFVLVMGLAIAKGWTEPTAVPPAGNVGAPINTGGLAQIKSGSLQVNGFRNLGLTLLKSSVGVGTAAADKANGIHASGDICTDMGGGKCLSDSSTGNAFKLKWQNPLPGCTANLDGTHGYGITKNAANSGGTGVNDCETRGLHICMYNHPVGKNGWYFITGWRDDASCNYTP